jgi:hypothetical protein
MTFIDIAEDLLGLAKEAREWWDDAAWHPLPNSGRPNLDAFMYERDTQSLSIQFHGNRVYKYFNIPPDMASGLANAASPGGWFHQNLRGAPFEKI